MSGRMKTFIYILLSLIFIVLLFDIKAPKKTIPSQPTPLPQSEVVKPPEKPVRVPTSAEYLKRAKALLSQKPEGASNDKEEHYLWKAENLLKAINPGSPESPEAEKLLKQIKSQQILLFKKAAVEEEKNTAALRKEYAEKLEFTYLDKLHRDTRVTVSGKNNTTIKIKWVLWSRVSVHEFLRDGTVLSQWREMGFKRYVLDGGYGGTWSDSL